MAQRLLVLRKVQVSLVAGDICPEADPLLRPIREPQVEAMILQDRRGHSGHLCIIPKIAQKVRLLLLPHVVGDMNGDMGVGLGRTALILKLP
jgi:hypothetical protein